MYQQKAHIVLIHVEYTFAPVPNMTDKSLYSIWHLKSLNLDHIYTCKLILLVILITCIHKFYLISMGINHFD